MLGVCHNAIKYQAIRLELEFPRFGPGPKIARMDEKIREVRERVKRAEDSKAETLAAYRNKWLKIIKEHPSANRSELLRLHQHEYNWLFANDKSWFEANAPAPTKRTDTNRKVDWISRDILLADKVRLSAIRLRNADGIPIRVSMQAIGRDIDNRDMLSKKFLPKLPLTQKALSEGVETQVEFYSRRLKWTANYFRQERIVPAFSTLGLRARIDWNSWYLPEIKSVFEAVIESLRKEAESGWVGADDPS
jgi:hypothetical protein